MAEGRIKLTENELEEFYTKLGSRHFKLQEEIFKEYGYKKLDIYFKLIEFTYQIVTVIGVIAGLGFTALSSIQNRYSFVMGEAFLFLGILFGIYLVHKIYSGELLSFQRAQNIHKKHFGERNEFFKKIWTELKADGANIADWEKLKQIDDKTSEIFDSKDEELDDIYRLKAYQRILLYFLAAGCFMILFSIIF